MLVSLSLSDSTQDTVMLVSPSLSDSTQDTVMLMSLSLSGCTQRIQLCCVTPPVLVAYRGCLPAEWTEF